MNEDTTAKTKIKIQPGVRIGQLTVKEKCGTSKHRYTIWRCSCDCGGEVQLDTRALQRGTITHCGCLSKLTPGQKDLTGMRFGKLVCIEPTERRGYHGGTIWLCKCDCGNECYAVSVQLTSGYKKSCGCLSYPPLKDFVGKKFGQLTVVAYEKKEKGHHFWRCSCSCGNETVVSQSQLQIGKTQSCGCIKLEATREGLKLIDGTSITVLEGIKKRSKSNTSGRIGVYYIKSNNKWAAHIEFKGKRYWLGSYSKYEDAVKAREKGEEMVDDFIEYYYSLYPEKRKKESEPE